jgi:pimeloyl-ACP methyl ester carboxylesterase
MVAGDTRLAVHDWGGAGAPVLLAHPTGFHGRVWEPVAGLLVAAGRQVFSFDFRGHGDSDAPPPDDRAYAWSRFADDARAVADHLGLTGVSDLVVGGHSKGGTALLLGEANAPGSYARIWTYEPIMFASLDARPRNDNFPLARAARKRRAIWDSVEQARIAYASKPPLDDMTDASLRAYVDYAFQPRADGTVELKCRPEVEATVYAMAPANGAFARLAKIDAPVVVAVGEVSKSVDPDLGREFADRLPHGTLEVMAGLGHFGPQQDPERCAASILRFAEGLAP